jgi:hypothetical protein
MKTIEKFWLTIFFLVIVTLVSYPIITPNDVLIKEDSDYLYYKEYSWWGYDSCCYKYHKPIYYNGKVVYKHENTHGVGVPGKGGHNVTETTIGVVSGNKIFEKVYEENGIVSTIKYNVGDKVRVTETFYPRYNIEFF